MSFDPERAAEIFCEAAVLLVAIVVIGILCLGTGVP